MTTNPWPTGRYIVDINGGPCVVVPAWAAALMHGELQALRIKARSRDAELAQVLLDLGRVAISVQSSVRGTMSAPIPEPAQRLSQWVTTTTAADILGITDRAVRRAISEGRLSAQKINGGWTVARAEVERYRTART